MLWMVHPQNRKALYVRSDQYTIRASARKTSLAGVGKRRIDLIVYNI